MPSYAHAQSFVNSTGGAINDSTFCLGGTNANGAGVVNDLERTFTVSGLSAITDINVGLVATHTWRGDMDVRLESPLGTEVQLINPDTSGAGNLDDYNIELSDENLEVVNTGTHNTANDTTAAFYEFFVRPDNVLSAFDGEDPNGTWTLKICDDYTGESGNFIRSELIFQPTTGADLSLSLTADNDLPASGDNVTLTLTATSEGPQNSTPTAILNLPAGVTLLSSSGDGSFDNATGIWSIGSGFAPGVPRSRTIVISLPISGSFPLTAEILTSNRTDPDSTPNNSDTSEDDYDALTINVQPSSTPPALNCPIADQFELVFGAPGSTNGWSEGDFIRTFTAFDPVSSTNIDLDFELSGETAFLGNISGLSTPVSQTTYNGGFTGDHSIGIAADFDSASKFVTMTMDIGVPGVGIEAFQFVIFDVDLGGWVDRLQFRGSLDGVDVTPIITPSAQNFVSGNEAIGQGGNAAQTSSAGNVIVTFNQPVDQVEWDYGNDASAGPDPAFQIIAMHTIKMCGRRNADLNAVKTVEVYDPGNLGLYMTPGNEVLYKITVTNSATATAPAEDVDISDTLPTNLRFMSATTTGFTGGSFGTPDLPAANTDCGVTPCIVRFFGGDVPINSTAEIEVIAVIK
ncbi:MAG: proprotein convertase P-domain-containing protein [Litorimonas sp.]